MLLRFSKLPNNAVPVDKLSFIGPAMFSGCTPSFRFVYRYRRRFYIIQCFGGFNAPISKLITTKDLLSNGVKNNACRNTAS